MRNKLFQLLKASEQCTLALNTTTAPTGDAAMLGDMFDVEVPPMGRQKREGRPSHAWITVLI
jgi:hypothetical protein